VARQATFALSTTAIDPPPTTGADCIHHPVGLVEWRGNEIRRLVAL
jgi:hypothetical protein